MVAVGIIAGIATCYHIPGFITEMFLILQRALDEWIVGVQKELSSCESSASAISVKANFRNASQQCEGRTENNKCPFFVNQQREFLVSMEASCAGQYRMK